MDGPTVGPASLSGRHGKFRKMDEKVDGAELLPGAITPNASLFC
jgi:hypothetical protein